MGWRDVARPQVEVTRERGASGRRKQQDQAGLYETSGRQKSGEHVAVPQFIYRLCG
jgi:hypothetical protein